MLEFLRKYKYYIILGLITIAALLFSLSIYRQYTNIKKQSADNIVALTDSLDFYKGKHGELIADKTLLIGDIELLKTTNADLYDELKSMKAKNAEQAIQIKGLIENPQIDTTWVINTDTTYIYPTFTKNFDFSNQYRTLTGFIECSNNNLGLTFTKDITNFDYTLAIQDGKVYITSSNPYVKYNEISGITLPKYKYKWSLVVGPSISVGYDPGSKTVVPTIGASLTLGYTLLSFGKQYK